MEVTAENERLKKDCPKRCKTEEYKELLIEIGDELNPFLDLIKRGVEPYKFKFMDSIKLKYLIKYKKYQTGLLAF